MLETINRAADASLAVYSDMDHPDWAHAWLRFENPPLKPVLYINEDGRQYLAIRGTANLSNWITNLSAWRRDWYGLRVHSGFADCADRILADVRPHVERRFIDYPIITGHSLGGVVALLVAAALGVECDVVAFGMPKSGAGPDLAASVKGRVLRIQNGSDAVPRRPFWRLYDGGQCCYIDNDGALVANPSLWYRFKDRTFMLAQWQQITDHSMAGYRDELAQSELPRSLW